MGDPQQGDSDRLGLQAQQATIGVAQSNIAAQQAQISVLHQQKDYQSVVAPFDGVITQRNIDVGSLVQADATSGTFMFAIMQDNVIRTLVYVPQDQAFGLEPGVDAVVHVPEIPDRGFPGEGRPHCRCAADGHADNAHGSRRTEPGWCPGPWGLLHRRAACPAESPSFIIPAGAIIFNAEGLHVAVVENGVVHFRKITVARDLGTTVEVHDGVTGRRPGHPQSAGRSGRRRQSAGPHRHAAARDKAY